jgi:hypothetical protein
VYDLHGTLSMGRLFAENPGITIIFHAFACPKVESMSHMRPAQANHLDHAFTMHLFVVLCSAAA